VTNDTNWSLENPLSWSTWVRFVMSNHVEMKSTNLAITNDLFLWQINTGTQSVVSYYPKEEPATGSPVALQIYIACVVTLILILRIARKQNS
jgi:hypothetical protein